MSRKHAYAEALAAADYDKPAEALRTCHEKELLLCCSHCSATRYVVYKCGHRCCPICAYDNQRLRRIFAEAMLRDMEFPKLITLTIPTSSSSPRETIKYLRSCFTKLRGRKIWDLVRGGCYQIECKFNKGHWHIHMHILADAKYMPYQRLYSDWSDITGVQGVQTHIKAARTKEERAYVVKYAVKADQFRSNPNLIVQWYEAVKGSRLFGTFGDWYNAKFEDLVDDTEYKAPHCVCESCGSEDSMFFARDGPYIYKKDWREIKCCYVDSTHPEERDYEPELFDFPHENKNQTQLDL